MDVNYVCTYVYMYICGCVCVGVYMWNVREYVNVVLSIEHLADQTRHNKKQLSLEVWRGNSLIWELN